MISNRMTGIIVGVLFLIGYVPYLPAALLLESILNAPDYLTSVSANQTQVVILVLLESTNHVAIVGIAVLLFPILKKYSEGLALWYAGFRIIEAAMYVVAEISTLSLITLSQEYVAAGAPDASYYQTLGALALAVRSWVGGFVNVIFFILGALILYTLLYQSKLVPRFISVWGFIAVALLTIANALAISLFGIGLALYLPIMANEIFLAIWLIVKGFNQSAIAS